MSQNAETALGQTGPFPKDSAAGGTSAAILAQATDGAHEGDGLFPGDDSLPIARPIPVQTSGRLEFAARCCNCKSWHRHVSLGIKVAPCGIVYRLEFATKLKGAA
jgi:hypothetical protein